MKGIAIDSKTICLWLVNHRSCYKDYVLSIAKLRF